MKVTIVNGDPGKNGAVLDSFIMDLSHILQKSGNEVKVWRLRDLEIKQCRGCFSCWVKHPGECHIHDQAYEVAADIINSDRLIMASPLLMGFVSSLTKRMMDRLIPLVLPDFEIIKGEMHHEKRYEKYPKFGVLLQKEEDTDNEDIEITARIFNRLAINFHSECLCVKTTESDPQEVADEITRY